MGPRELPSRDLARRDAVKIHLTARGLSQGALLATLLTARTASVVAAHVELISSSPAAGANLSTAPSKVSITFDDELDPDLSSFTVTASDATEVGSGAVDLTVADRNVMTGTVSISQPGIYTVSYRAAGVDGHLLEGAFSFGFRATLSIPAPTYDASPDTAMPAPSEGQGAILAIVVLLATLAFIIRRLETH